MNLSQGQRPVSDYTIEFWTLAAEVDWTEGALRVAFTKGLTEQIKDELVSRDEPTNRVSLISLSNGIDNHLHSRRSEKATPFPVSMPQPPPATPVCTPIQFSSPASPQTPSEEPMQLDRAHLTLEEKYMRRGAGECLYCGKKGHFIALCPIRLPYSDPQVLFYSVSLLLTHYS